MQNVMVKHLGTADIASSNTIIAGQADVVFLVIQIDDGVLVDSKIFTHQILIICIWILVIKSHVDGYLIFILKGGQALTALVHTGIPVQALFLTLFQFSLVRYFIHDTGQFLSYEFCRFISTLVHQPINPGTHKILHLQWHGIRYQHRLILFHHSSHPLPYFIKLLFHFWIPIT